MSFGKLTRSHQVRRKKVATGFVLAMLLVLGSGCDKGWLAYQQIKLGRPLSPEHLLVREGRAKDKAKGWGESAACHIPPVIAWDGVGVLLDADGNVRARRYIAVALGHWGLFMTIAARSVLEVEVPAPPFGKLPATPSDPSNPPATLGQYLKLVEEDLSLDNTEALEEPLGACFLNRLAYIATGHALFTVSSFVGELGGVIDEHPDAMSRGYELRCSDDYGRRFRVRNLGGRRIRIEANWFRIIDPLGLALWIGVPPQLRVDTWVADKQSTTGIQPDSEN
jgi:hypothetical protein